MTASRGNAVRPTMSVFRFQALMCSLMLSYFCSQPVHSSRQAVPLNKWKELSAVTGNKQFIYGYVDGRPPSGVRLPANERILFNDTAPGFSAAGVDIIAGQVAEPEGCLPQERAVSIPPSSDPRIIRWPPCTRLAQCGGCCGTDVLECTATRTEPATIQVMKVIYSESGSGDFEFVGLEDLVLTKHLECDCRCRVQPHHCNPVKQDYNEQSCSCRCRNENEATSCPSQKRWDDKECACVCPRILNCLDDEFFSYSSCSCQRRTLGELNSPPPLALATPAPSDPCATVTCRAGYRPVSTGASCVCRIQTRSSAIRARAAVGNHRQWSRGSSDFDLDLD